jgi:hypothetical protein
MLDYPRRSELFNHQTREREHRISCGCALDGYGHIMEVRQVWVSVAERVRTVWAR